jgi:hypothetical protein
MIFSCLTLRHFSMALPFIISIIVALEILLGSESVGDTTLGEL